MAKFRKKNTVNNVEVIIEAEPWNPDIDMPGITRTQTGQYARDFRGVPRKLQPGDYIMITSKGDRVRLRKAAMENYEEIK